MVRLDLLNKRRQLIEGELFKIHFSDSLIDVNAHQVSVDIIVTDNALRDFPLLSKRGRLRQVDIERIRVRVTIMFHDLNPLSGKLA